MRLRVLDGRRKTNNDGSRWTRHKDVFLLLALALEPLQPTAPQLSDCLAALPWPRRFRAGTRKGAKRFIWLVPNTPPTSSMQSLWTTPHFSAMASSLLVGAHSRSPPQGILTVHRLHWSPEGLISSPKPEPKMLIAPLFVVSLSQLAPDGANFACRGRIGLCPDMMSLKPNPSSLVEKGLPSSHCLVSQL